MKQFSRSDSIQASNLLTTCSSPNNFLARPGLPAGPSIINLMKPSPRLVTTRINILIVETFFTKFILNKLNNR
jgi:hypothetical protein